MNSGINHIVRIAKSVFDGLFGNIAPNQINWLMARFSDSEEEAEYQKSLIEIELPKDRLVNYFGIAIYIIFGFLDLVTFDEKLNEVLILRWAVCAPIAILLITMTFAEPLKKYFQYVTIAVMAIGAGSMVVMIGLMEKPGGPPYIVGILAIFIFFACIQRMHYWLAATVYIATIASYSSTMVWFNPKSSEEIVSGHFFMIFIASIALITTYMQEIRSRIDHYQRRQREADAVYIEELLIEATAADQAKISFLSILSHEMRTPLHQIVGFSEVVQNSLEREPHEESQKYLEEIRGSASGLLSTIGKILRYADATAGKVSYDFEPISVKYLVETVVEQALVKSESMKVSIEVGALEPAMLRIDHPHTCYALGHLIENAINATDSKATVEITGALGDAETYVLEIRDFGCGMTQEGIDAAMTPFTQTEFHKTRNRAGVGIGLTLAQKILVDQKASLALRSKPGEGTTAIIRIPVYVKDQENSASKASGEANSESADDFTALAYREQENR